MWKQKCINFGRRTHLKFDTVLKSNYFSVCIQYSLTSSVPILFLSLRIASSILELADIMTSKCAKLVRENALQVYPTIYCSKCHFAWWQTWQSYRSLMGSKAVEMPDGPIYKLTTHFSSRKVISAKLFGKIKPAKTLNEVACLVEPHWLLPKRTILLYNIIIDIIIVIKGLYCLIQVDELKPEEEVCLLQEINSNSHIFK